MELNVSSADTFRLGRAASVLEVDYVRDLQPLDVLAVHALPAGTEKKPLQKVRGPHHQLARLLADGKQVVEVSRMTGYSTSRITDLAESPAFQHLVQYYRDNKDAVWANVHEQIAGVAETALSIMQERLEETPEAFSNDDLRKLTEGQLDRAGYGPTKTVNKNTVDLTGLARLKAEADKERTGKVIDRPLALPSS